MTPATRYCEHCGNPIQYHPKQGAARYRMRRFCCQSCASIAVPRVVLNSRRTVGTDDASLVRAYIDDIIAEMERAMIAVTDNPLKTLPPQVKKLWCPMRHKYYVAMIGVIR